MKNKLRNFLRKRILPLALGSAMSFGMSAYFPAGDVVSAEETDLSMVTVTQTESGEKFMSNGYIGIEYNDDGRFTIRTTGGDPDNPDDDNKKLLFYIPSTHSSTSQSYYTSYATISVDGKQDVFCIGDIPDNDSISYPKTDLMNIRRNGDVQFYPESGMIITSVMVTGKPSTTLSDCRLEVNQILSIVNNPATGRNDLVEIRYEVRNMSSDVKNIGLRILLDTMNDENDGCLFRVPGYGDIDNETEFTGNEVPKYWQTFDDRTDPSFISIGTMERKELPDKIQFCNWYYRKTRSGAYYNIWDYQIDPERKIEDSAVTLTWEEEIVEAGCSTEFVTYYGLDSFSLDMTAEGPEKIAVVNNQYSSEPLLITANVTNTTDYPVEDAEISLDIWNLLLSDESDTLTKTINVASHQTEQVTWSVVVDPDAVYWYEEAGWCVSLRSSQPYCNKYIDGLVAIPELEPTPEPEPTETPEPEPTETPEPVPTETPEPEPTETPEPVPTETPDPVPTETPEPTNTPDPVPTETPEPEPTNTPDPVPTETPEPEPTNTPDPVPTETPEPTNTPDPVPTETPEPEPTNTPDPVPTETPEPEPTNTPDPVPTETPEPEPTNTPDPMPTETPEPEPTTTPEPQPTEHPSYVLYSGSETEDFSLYCWKSTFNGDVYTGRNFVCGASELYLNGRLDTVNNVTANGWQINIDEKNENTARVDMPDWGSNILANAGNIEQFDQDVVMIEDKNIVNGSISTSGNVVINGTTFEGDCFIIADGDITYNVSDFTSTGRVVLYSRNGNVTINGNTCDLNGIIYAPNGKVSFNTNVTNINGRVFADRISFSGSVFNVTGNDSDFELID